MGVGEVKSGQQDKAVMVGCDCVLTLLLWSLVLF